MRVIYIFMRSSANPQSEGRLGFRAWAIVKSRVTHTVVLKGEENCKLEFGINLE